MKVTGIPELQWGRILMVPILHNRVEFATEVQKAFEAFQPDHVAVEYPDTLKGKIISGVGRLPLLSVVHYEESDGVFVYLPIEPTDGQVEAIRLALSRGTPVHFVDRDTDGYLPDFSPMPDSYAVTRIGYAAYCRAYMAINQDEPASSHDLLRGKDHGLQASATGQDGQQGLFCVRAVPCPQDTPAFGPAPN